eukprot:10488406-Alexandrium_andersonii.AAC.1
MISHSTLRLPDRGLAGDLRGRWREHRAVEPALRALVPRPGADGSCVIWSFVCRGGLEITLGQPFCVSS